MCSNEHLFDLPSNSLSYSRKSSLKPNPQYQIVAISVELDETYMFTPTSNDIHSSDVQCSIQCAKIQLAFGSIDNFPIIVPEAQKPK